MFNSNSPGTIILTTSPPVVYVTGVTLNANSKYMKPGDTFNLTATLSPSNATYPEVVYSSSNPAVATVSATGVITAKAIGTARITITARDGNLTAYCDVNASLTALNSIDDGSKLAAWTSKNGSGVSLLNISGVKSNDPVEVQVVDLMGKTCLEQKAVVTNQDMIQLPVNWTKSSAIGIVRLKYSTGEAQTVKINFGLSK